MWMKDDMCIFSACQIFRFLSIRALSCLRRRTFWGCRRAAAQKKMVRSTLLRFFILGGPSGKIWNFSFSRDFIISSLFIILISNTSEHFVGSTCSYLIELPGTVIIRWRCKQHIVNANWHVHTVSVSNFRFLCTSALSCLRRRTFQAVGAQQRKRKWCEAVSCVSSS